MKTVELEALGFEHFAERLQDIFRVCLADSQSVELRLIEATLARPSGRGPMAVERRSAAFALLFSGPPDAPLPQRMYPLENEKIGRFEIFIVPVGRDGDRLLYEAVFNRLPKAK